MIKNVLLLAIGLSVTAACPAGAQNTGQSPRQGANRFSEEFLERNAKVSFMLDDAYKLFQSGRVDAALFKYQQALELWDDCSPAYRGVLECYVAKGDDKRVFAMYQELFRADAKISISSWGPATTHRMRYVLMLLKAGKKEECAKIFNETMGGVEYWRQYAYPNEPSLPDRFDGSTYSSSQLEAAARAAVAFYEYHQGNDKVALQELDKALKLRKQIPFASFYQGQIGRYKAETYEQATDAYLTALRHGGKAMRTAVLYALEDSWPQYKENATARIHAEVEKLTGLSAKSAKPGKMR